MDGFELRVSGRLVDVAHTGQRIIAYLALQQKPQERSLVAGMLWPDRGDERATANLRSSLWRLPKIDGHEFVRARQSQLELASSCVVDVRELERVGWALLQDGRRHLDDVMRLGWELFVADLLPGWYDDWVIARRERLGQLQLHFMEALAYALLGAGRMAEALDVAIRLVNADQLREGSQLALLRIYCAEGHLGAARRQLDRYRSELISEFGCEPDLSIERVLADVRRARRRPAPNGRPSASLARRSVRFRRAAGGRQRAAHLEVVRAAPADRRSCPTG